MRIVKEKRFIEFYKQERYWKEESSIRSWIFEARFSQWNNAAELKAKYKNASIVSSKRVVFNIKGNKFRLVADIEYRLRIIFVVWFGTHDEYEKIDVKTVDYDN